MSKHLLIAFFLLAGTLSALPQRYYATLNIDSLKKILITAKDTQRVNTLNLLARRYLYGERTKNNRAYAQHYAEEALPLARNLHYNKGLGNALLNEGILLDDKGFTSLKKALPLLHQAADEYAIAACFNSIAECYHTLGENKTAIAFYDSAQTLSMKLGDISSAAWGLAYIGHLYFDLGNYVQAYKTGQAAWELVKETDTLVQTLSLAHLANLFLGAGLPEMTIKYLHKILLFYPGLMNQKKAEVNWPLTWALERGGQAFLQLNQVDSALKIAQVLHIPFDEQDNTNHLFNGLLYAALHQYEKALPHFKQGYLSAKQQAYPISLTSHAGELGKTYLALKDFRKAIYYTEEALRVAQKIHALLEMKNAALTLTKIYDQTKNYSKAYFYNNLYKSFNDSLAPEEYKRKLSLIQVQNELEIQKQKAQLLGKENQLKQQQLKSESLLRNILIGSMLAVLLLGIFIFRNIAFRNRLNQKLKAIELRNTISRDLHDDVGSTLSSIRFLSSMALDDVDSDKDKTHSTLRSINESAERMLDAMNDIIWSIQPQNDTLENIFVRMISFASELLEAQKIKLYWKVADAVKPLQLELSVRHDFLLIFKEAVNNLAKYSEATEAYINLEYQQSLLILTIHDNGKGFDPEATNAGNGLHNMQNRAQKIGAIYHLRTAIGRGTAITLKVKPT